jgi:Ni/Fe-hydrogenase subunit HybB-like protein
VLVVYIVFRAEDLALRGALPAAFTLDMPALLFWLENLLFVFVPVVVVFRTAGRMTTRSLFVASFSAVLGFIMHRFNVAVSGMQLIKSTGYFPTWMEVVISFGLVAIGFMAAGLAIRFLPVRQEDPAGTSTIYSVRW